MATFGWLATFVIDSGVDHTGLGRWSWQMIGKGDTVTVVVAAYQPCEKNKNSKGYTTFEQHERYFEPKGDFRSPRTIFFEQLVSQLRLWKVDGKEIILCSDFNEHIYEGQISRRLAREDLRMKEQCCIHNGDRLPATFVRGTRPIDGVFATGGIEVIHAGILGKYAGVGDHRCFVLDFTSKSVLGTSFPRVLPHSGRKLNCYCERIRDTYNMVLDELADRHEMYRKLDDLTQLADLISPTEFQIKINKWDDELTDYMQDVEDKCHKFKQNHVDWSPKYGVWNRRQRLLLWVEKYLDGKVPDSRNLIWDCMKKKICNPWLMTKELLKVDLFFCKKEMENLKAKAPEMQRKHLQKRLEFHQKAGNEKAIVDVTRIIRYESDEKRYNRLRWSTKPKQGGSVYNVRVKNGDTEEVINTEESIFKHVSEHLSDQFRLTFTAKCYNGKLFDDIGFIGDTDAARSILEGTYNYPPDLDTATKLLFEEAVITYSKMPKEELATYVTVEDY